MSNDSRPAAVAGMFYPESAALLAGTVAEMLDQAATNPPLRPKAIIAPHAGYVYSGGCAGQGYARVEPTPTIILLGVNHRGAGAELPSEVLVQLKEGGDYGWPYCYHDGVKLVLAIIALGLALKGLEHFGLIPDWAQMDRPRGMHLPRP